MNQPHMTIHKFTEIDEVSNLFSSVLFVKHKNLLNEVVNCAADLK